VYSLHTVSASSLYMVCFAYPLVEDDQTNIVIEVYDQDPRVSRIHLIENAHNTCPCALVMDDSYLVGSFNDYRFKIWSLINYDLIIISPCYKDPIYSLCIDDLCVYTCVGTVLRAYSMRSCEGNDRKQKEAILLKEVYNAVEQYM
jgi:hypothetical protein